MARIEGRRCVLVSCSLCRAHRKLCPLFESAKACPEYWGQQWLRHIQLTAFRLLGSGLQYAAAHGQSYAVARLQSTSCFKYLLGKTTCHLLCQHSALGSCTSASVDPLKINRTCVVPLNISFLPVYDQEERISEHVFSNARIIRKRSTDFTSSHNFHLTHTSINTRHQTQYVGDILEWRKGKPVSYGNHEEMGLRTR
jgi:hypothetical protein